MMHATHQLARSFRAVAPGSKSFSYISASVLLRRPIASCPKLRTFPAVTSTPLSHRSFRTSAYQHKGLSPDSSEPKAPNTESSVSEPSSLEAAKISDSQYHEIADQYLNSLVLTMEEIADNDATKGLEVEYSAGVLSFSHPKGTYVINKQPPNKQIWLASPISGPKRFDWVLADSGDLTSQHDKQDSETNDLGDDGTVAGGKWIYLRDGSSLSEILRKEVDVEITHGAEADVAPGREGPGASGT